MDKLLKELSQNKHLWNDGVAMGRKTKRKVVFALAQKKIFHGDLDDFQGLNVQKQSLLAARSHESSQLGLLQEQGSFADFQ